MAGGGYQLSARAAKALGALNKDRKLKGDLSGQSATRPQQSHETVTAVITNVVGRQCSWAQVAWNATTSTWGTLTGGLTGGTATNFAVEREGRAVVIGDIVTLRREISAGGALMWSFDAPSTRAITINSARATGKYNGTVIGAGTTLASTGGLAWPSGANGHTATCVVINLVENGTGTNDLPGNTPVAGIFWGLSSDGWPIYLVSHVLTTECTEPI